MPAEAIIWGITWQTPWQPLTAPPVVTVIGAHIFCPLLSYFEVNATACYCIYYQIAAVVSSFLGLRYPVALLGTLFLNATFLHSVMEPTLCEHTTSGAKQLIWARMTQAACLASHAVGKHLTHPAKWYPSKQCKLLLHLKALF